MTVCTSEEKCVFLLKKIMLHSVSVQVINSDPTEFYEREKAHGEGQRERGIIAPKAINRVEINTYGLAWFDCEFFQRPQ